MAAAVPIPKKGKQTATSVMQGLGGLDLAKIDDLGTLRTAIDKLRAEMQKAAADLEFERAATLRDKARELEQLELTLR